MQYTLAILAAVALVKASPFPQAVTAAISPSGSAPPGCMPTFTGSFGIAVMNVSTSSMQKRQVTQSPDGQPVAASVTATPVSQQSDGQPNATPMMMAPVSMIMDGQIQGGMHTMMMMPVNQIMDGQPQQATATAVSQIGDGQPQAQTFAPVTVMSDGQPQAPTMHMTASAVSQTTDGQPQAPTASASAVSQTTDGQPQAPTAAASAVSQKTDAQPQAPTATAPAVSQTTDAQPQAPPSAGAPAPPPSPSASGSSSSGGTVMVACASNSTLELTLADGVLKDAKGRTGYIAANYQFQFDAPPQAGALFTTGFSVCGNGSLALGGSNVFYQCLSGSFYNLYDRNWAAQCSPVTINSLMLKQCA